MNKGFADFFFKPSPAAPVSAPYTYLLEVKYAKAGASEKRIRALADDAREQLIRYSKDECVAEAREKGGAEIDYNRVAQLGTGADGGGRIDYQPHEMCG